MDAKRKTYVWFVETTVERKIMQKADCDLRPSGDFYDGTECFMIYQSRKNVEFHSYANDPGKNTKKYSFALSL